MASRTTEAGCMIVQEEVIISTRIKPGPGTCMTAKAGIHAKHRPDLDGCYSLASAEDSEFPIWGHGMKRLYKDDVANRWAICLNPASIEEMGGVLCSSTEEPHRDRPDQVKEWVFHNGSDWVETSAIAWTCTRPPPIQLQVTCPEKKELNGSYKLYKDQINGKPTWSDGDNFIYFTSNKAWAVCIGKSSTENDRGWLYAKSRESKTPDKVAEWHVYDGKEWNESKGSSCIVPEGNRRRILKMPVFGDRPGTSFGPTCRHGRHHITPSERLDAYLSSEKSVTEQPVTTSEGQRSSLHTTIATPEVIATVLNRLGPWAGFNQQAAILELKDVFSEKDLEKANTALALLNNATTDSISTDCSLRSDSIAAQDMETFQEAARESVLKSLELK